MVVVCMRNICHLSCGIIRIPKRSEDLYMVRRSGREGVYLNLIYCFVLNDRVGVDGRNSFRHYESRYCLPVLGLGLLEQI